MPHNTILVVDDDPDILTYYRKIFSQSCGDEYDILGGKEESRDQSLDCLTYSDPHELLEYYERAVKAGQRHPLCIIDMRMPRQNGLMTAQRMREIDPGIDIVICSAFSDIAPDEIRAKLHEGVFFVRKPFVAEPPLALNVWYIKS